MGIATALLEPRNDLMNDGGVKMPKHTVSCSAKCPFYQGEERHEIYCSGLGKGMATHVAFASPAKRKEWATEYCKSIEGCRKCRVRKMLESAGV